MSIPGCRYRPAFRIPSLSAEKSGSRSFLLRNGVWMESATASSPAIFEKSAVHSNFFAATTFVRRSSRLLSFERALAPVQHRDLVSR
jgi:hypothetical protein